MFSGALTYPLTSNLYLERASAVKQDIYVVQYLIFHPIILAILMEITV